MAKAKDQTEYIGWYYQTDFEFLQDPSVKQVIIYGDTSLDLQLDSDLPALIQLKPLWQALLKRPLTWLTLTLASTFSMHTASITVALLISAETVSLSA